MSEKRVLEDTEEDDFNKRPDVFRSTVQEIVCVLTLTMSTSLMSLNTGGLIVTLPSIGKDLGISGGMLSWAISVSSLATGSSLLISGQLADVFGRRRMVLFAYGFYTVCSLLCGFLGWVKVYVPFLIFRAFQGVCASLCVTASAGILGATYSPCRRKNYAMATFAAGAPVGFVFGILSGGICNQILTWYSVLWFFAILYAGLTVVAWFVVPLDEQPLRLEILSKLDWCGAALALCGFALFVFSLAQADSAPQGWRTPYIIALLIVGVALIAAFCVYEGYVPSRPLMPLRIWTYPGMALCLVIASCGWMDFQGTLTYYGTLYFQNIQGASPILTTAYFVPQAISGILVNVVAGYALDRVPGRILMIIAMLGFTAAALLWSFVQPDTLYWALPFPALIVVVIGADLAYNVANLHALSTVDKSLQSTAAGVFNTTLQLSGTIGLAASAAVVNSVVEGQETASKDELMKGYRAGYYFALGISGLGLILSFFLKVGTTGHRTQPTNN